MEPVRQEDVACDQCGSRHATPIAHGGDREYFTSDDVYTAVRCDDCGLLYLNPRPVAAELSRIYPEVYHSYILDEAEGSRGSFITRMRQKAAANRFRPVLKHLGDRPAIDILDVGCGNGWGLDLFKACAPERVRTFGVEIAPEACDAAERHGHKTYCGRFEDVAVDRQFDVVNLTHVIEHVSSPRLVARKAFEVLRPGGLLVLETPAANSVDYGWFKDGTWGAYHFPRHWYFFTPDSLAELGRLEGFEQVDSYYHPSPTVWTWTAHNLALQAPEPLRNLGRWLFDPVRIFRGGLVSTAVMSGFFILDMGFKLMAGRTSVMTGIFRKPHAA